MVAFRTWQFISDVAPTRQSRGHFCFAASTRCCAAARSSSQASGPLGCVPCPPRRSRPANLWYSHVGGLSAPQALPTHGVHDPVLDPHAAVFAGYKEVLGRASPAAPRRRHDSPP
eukprot:6344223-Prymnesium_polylepis.2